LLVRLDFLTQEVFLSLDSCRQIRLVVLGMAQVVIWLNTDGNEDLSSSVVHHSPPSIQH